MGWEPPGLPATDIGTIQEITSSGGTLTITEPTGPNTNIEAIDGGPGFPAFISTRWYPQVFATGTPLAVTGNGAILLPFFVGKPRTFSAIGSDITIGGTGGTPTLRFGLYADNGSGYPGGLIKDYGTVAATGTGATSIAASVTLAAGLYWMLIVAQGATTTQPTLVTGTTASPGLLTGIIGSTTTGAATTSPGYSLAGVSAALPNPFTIGAAPVSFAASVVIQLQAA